MDTILNKLAVFLQYVKTFYNDASAKNYLTDIQGLPSEIVLHIAKFLNISDILSMKYTCSYFDEVLDFDAITYVLTKQYYNNDKFPLCRLHTELSDQEKKILTILQPQLLQFDNRFLSKSLTDTAIFLRAISNDTEMNVYPQCENTVDVRTMGMNAIHSIKRINDETLAISAFQGQVKQWNLTQSNNQQLKEFLPELNLPSDDFRVMGDSYILLRSQDAITLWDFTKPADQRRKIVIPVQYSLGRHYTLIENRYLLISHSKGNIPRPEGTEAACEGMKPNLLHSNSCITIWDLKKSSGPECIKTLEGHDNTISTICLKNGLIVSISSKIIKVWDLTKPDGEECVKTLPVNRYINMRSPHIMELKNGYLLLWQPHYYHTKNVLVFNLNKPDGKECIKNLHYKHLPSFGLCTELTDKRLVFNCRNDGIILDLTKPDGEECVKVLSGHEELIIKLDELKDGRLISYSLDNTMKIWDLTKPDGEECIHTLKGHNHHIQMVIQQENWRLTSIDEHTIKTWNLYSLRDPDYS
ncbi:MAG: hypothetical protein OXC48_08400 [Endozoicomonadaceae bacterium]|nr:hypothetical protein [Endozoicomonadaceae bacterium]